MGELLAGYAASIADVTSCCWGGDGLHGLLGEVASVSGLPLVVHVDEDGTDEPDDGGVVGEDAHTLERRFSVSATARSWVATEAASGWAKMVRIMAVTISPLALPTRASTHRDPVPERQ